MRLTADVDGAVARTHAVDYAYRMNVVVIGAGVIGAACADALAADGHAVRILDMRSPGRGASQASAGMLVPFIEASDGDPLLDLLTKSLAMYDDFIASLRERSGRAIEYARTGSLHVAMTDADVARLTALAAWLNDRRLACRWLEGEALRQADPVVTPKALGALQIDTHGFVSVQDLVPALMQAARFSGAICETPVEAARVDARADSARVIIGNNARAIDADAVVLAAGAWSGRVHVNGVPDLPVKPIRGQLLHLRWPDAVAMPKQIAWGGGCYTVPWANRTLLVGATAEDAGFDERSTVAGVSTLMAAVVSLLPDASRAALAEVRVGLRPAAPTHMPIIGPVAGQPRVIAATGHLRNGIMLAPMTATLVRQAIRAMGQ